MNSINWKNALYTILFIAAITSIINWVMGDRIFSLPFIIDCIGKAAAVIAFLSSAFCCNLWKSSLFKKWLVLIPDISGQWTGKIVSNWIDPNTNQKLAPIDATLTIKQSLFKISCIIKTDESESRSKTASFSIDLDDQVEQLIYTYQNDPKQTVQERSRIHYGTAVLNIKRIKGKMTLEGDYWTSRNTSGCLTFKAGKKKK